MDRPLSEFFGGERSGETTQQMMGLFRATFSYAGFSFVGIAFGSVMRTARIQEIQKPRK